MYQAGFIDYWRREFNHGKTFVCKSKENKKPEKLRQLNLKDLGSAFFVLAIGIGVSAIIFLCEQFGRKNCCRHVPIVWTVNHCIDDICIIKITKLNLIPSSSVILFSVYLALVSRRMIIAIFLCHGMIEKRRETTWALSRDDLIKLLIANTPFPCLRIYLIPINPQSNYRIWLLGRGGWFFSLDIICLTVRFLSVKRIATDRDESFDVSFINKAWKFIHLVIIFNHWNDRNMRDINKLGET